MLQVPVSVPWVSGAIHTETKPYAINIEIEYYNIRLHLNLNLNSLLVKRQIDNPSPGGVTGGN